MTDGLIFKYLVDGLVWPFSPFGESAQIIGVSCVVGVLFLLAFARLSSQGAIRRVKRSIHASLLETIVFRHQPRACLAAQGRMLLGAGWYFLLAVPPVLVLALPFVLLAAELQVRFGYRSPAPGEALIVRALFDQRELVQTASLRAQDAAMTVVGPVRAPATREVYWRAQAFRPGVHELALAAGGKQVTLQVPVGQDAGRIEPYTYGHYAQRLPYVGQRAVRLVFGGAVEELELYYPDRAVNFWGWHMHWFLPFLCISIVAGLIGSRLFGIEV